MQDGIHEDNIRGIKTRLLILFASPSPSRTFRSHSIEANIDEKIFKKNNRRSRERSLSGTETRKLEICD